MTRRAALALGAGAFGAPGVLAQVPSGWPGLPARIATQRPDVQSVAVVQRGALVFDFLRAGLRADSLQDVQSVTKSVLALLFGCALADGHVRGVDELVALRLPQLLRLGGDERLRRLRFVHQNALASPSAVLVECRKGGSAEAMGDFLGGIA